MMGMTWLLLILLLVLPGCSRWVQEQRDADIADCAARIDPSWSPETTRWFMNRCIRVQPGGGGSYAATGYYGGLGYSPTDAFGPYGYRGPTWEQFNGQFQAPSHATVIPPPTR